jgi:phospholipid/cholesterol/gamma-HCH transport system substrate-binding protein
MRTNVIEALIGAVVLVVAGVFLTYAYSASDVGRVSGIKVGSVTDQTLDENTFQAVVHMSIDPRIKLPEDSSAKVTSDGLLGSNYVLIEPGGSPDLLESGGRIQFTQSSVDLMSLLGQAVFQMGTGGDEKK